jgi:hypothetical protein
MLLAAVVAATVTSGCASDSPEPGTAGGGGRLVVTNDLDHAVSLGLCDEGVCSGERGDEVRPSASATFTQRPVAAGDVPDMVRVQDGAASRCFLVPPPDPVKPYTVRVSQMTDECPERH